MYRPMAIQITGAAVYDSVRYQGQKGWFQVGGTSLAAPLIAGVYGLAGDLTAFNFFSQLYAICIVQQPLRYYFW